jgi:hypothetical protein
VDRGGFRLRQDMFQVVCKKGMICVLVALQMRHEVT